jgi:hypothetical protein
MGSATAEADSHTVREETTGTSCMSRGVAASEALRRSAAFLFDLEFLGEHFCLHHDLAMLTNPVTMRQRGSQLSAEKAVTGLLEWGWLGHGVLPSRWPVYKP